MPDAEDYRVESRAASSSAWNYAYTTSPSYLVSTLSCGAPYEFQVRARGDGDPYSTKYGDPSSKVSASTSACPTPTPTPGVKETIPTFGLQADRLVQYTIEGNPSEAFKEAITIAAAKWNAAVGVSSPDGPGVLFCQRPTDPTRLPGAALCPPSTSTDDGYTVTIKVVSSTDLGTACNKGPACVKGEDTEAIQANDAGHLLNMRMFIEDDTWVRVESMPTRVVWTNNPDDHGEDANLEDGGVGQQIYLRAIIMHEFGHTAGLADICIVLKLDSTDCEAAGYRGHLMAHNTEWLEDNYTEIPEEDTDYLGQAYRDEDE